MNVRFFFFLILSLVQIRNQFGRTVVVRFQKGDAVVESLEMDVSTSSPPPSSSNKEQQQQQQQPIGVTLPKLFPTLASLSFDHGLSKLNVTVVGSASK
jgi:hypothetical protein